MSSNKSKTDYTSQTIDNLAFDEEYLLPRTTLMTENTAGDAVATQKEIATEATQQSVLAAVQSIGGSASYRLIKMDYDGNADLSYKGQNTDDTAADADTDWSIIKYVRDVDGTLLSKITKTGSWEGRVALFS